MTLIAGNMFVCLCKSLNFQMCAFRRGFGSWPMNFSVYYVDLGGKGRQVHNSSTSVLFVSSGTVKSFFVFERV